MDIKTVIIKPQDIAGTLRRNIYTVQSWVRRGKLPPFDIEISSRVRGWDYSTLNAFDPTLTNLVASYLLNLQEPAQ